MKFISVKISLCPWSDIPSYEKNPNQVLQHVPANSEKAISSKLARYLKKKT